jgi:hypothetical protein
VRSHLRWSVYKERFPKDKPAEMRSCSALLILLRSSRESLFCRQGSFITPALAPPASLRSFCPIQRLHVAECSKLKTSSMKLRLVLF